MEQVILLILFILPGVLVNMIYKRIFPSSGKGYESYDKITIAALYSIFILLLNLLILKYVFKVEIYTISYFQYKFNSITFVWQYILITSITSILFTYIMDKFNKIVFIKVVNKIRKRMNLSEESEQKSVWDLIFENGSIDLKSRVVTIEKDGQLVTQGFLNIYSPPQNKNREICLIYSNYVKRIMDEDVLKDDEQKILNTIDYEYYDFESSTLIKIYDSEKICTTLE